MFNPARFKIGETALYITKHSITQVKILGAYQLKQESWFKSQWQYVIESRFFFFKHTVEELDLIKFYQAK